MFYAPFEVSAPYVMNYALDGEDAVQMPVGYNQIENCYQSLHERFVIACLTRFTAVKRKRPGTVLSARGRPVTDQSLELVPVAD